ncbi:AIF_collapsed_G0032000.mRNA.1.CDS.1 [Saccharomyces cerevisiae]|nr:AIF_collapsed_G0032000.mRNA.1.CDS.1 [Saccharomyces cerevisiae]
MKRNRKLGRPGKNRSSMCPREVYLNKDRLDLNNKGEEPPLQVAVDPLSFQIQAQGTFKNGIGHRVQG